MAGPDGDVLDLITATCKRMEDKMSIIEQSVEGLEAEVAIPGAAGSSNISPGALWVPDRNFVVAEDSNREGAEAGTVSLASLGNPVGSDPLLRGVSKSNLGNAPGVAAAAAPRKISQDFYDSCDAESFKKIIANTNEPAGAPEGAPREMRSKRNSVDTIVGRMRDVQVPCSTRLNTPSS